MTVRAYCPCKICTGKSPGDPGYGLTASGHAIGEHGGKIIAASLPEGTRIRVPGWGTGLVWDTGPAATGDRIAVLFPDHASAVAWGVRRLSVEVIPRSPGHRSKFAKGK